MVSLILIRALIVLACTVLVHTQMPGPELFDDPEPPAKEHREHMEEHGFDLSQIQFGMSCTPGMPMPMPGDGSMPGGFRPDPPMTDGAPGNHSMPADRPMPGGRPDGSGPDRPTGSMPGNGSMPSSSGSMPGGSGSMPGGSGSMPGSASRSEDSMQGYRSPCIRCGCTSVDDTVDEHQIRCRLTPGGTMCAMLEELKQKLVDSCDPGDYMEESMENPCGCKCTEEGKWECWSNHHETGMPNSHCLFLLNHRFIDLAPNRVHDVSVLYPQHCKDHDSITPMGQYKVYENCKICECVDGLWQCVQRENCMNNAEAEACQDRSGLYPLGTYTQDGPTYRMCVFGRWQDAKFTAAIPKPGRCPAMEMMGSDYICDGMMHSCVHDIHCQGKMKCCLGPCGGVCIMPDMHDGMGMGMNSSHGMTDGKGDDYMMMEYEHCQLENGDWIPHGKVQATGYCETVVCVNGTKEYYMDDQCNSPPTCTCGPPGTDMADQSTKEFPFGFMWNVTKCTQCVCVSGDWKCYEKKPCKSSRDNHQPLPCTVSETHHMSVPTGHMSSNGCCVCMNGLWMCDSPDCNNDLMYHPHDCLDMNGNVKSRHGAYKMKDKCKLCMCLDGEYQCSDICDYDYDKSKKMKRKQVEMMCPAVPDDGPYGACADFCSGDESCPDGEMCCSNGCGHLCLPSVPVPKSGTCPMVDGDVVGSCVEECQDDYDCSGRTKCCSNGCGHVCLPVIPDVTPMSMCPNAMFHCPIAEKRKDMCDSDMDCFPGSMCCSNGCYRNCTAGHADYCPAGMPMVKCFEDPCTVNACPASPNATCKANYCGGCNAVFYNSEGKEINCATGLVMECPQQEQCPAMSSTLSECEDDGDCEMGSICCRGSKGCIGMCKQKRPLQSSTDMSKEEKEGICPFKSPPPRFDNSPFPWDEFKEMMRGGMGGDMDGMGGGSGGRSKGMGGGPAGGRSKGMGGGPAGGMSKGMGGGMSKGMGGGPAGGMSKGMGGGMSKGMGGGPAGGRSKGMGGGTAGGMSKGMGGGMSKGMGGGPAGGMSKEMGGGMSKGMGGGMIGSIGDKWDRLRHSLGNNIDMYKLVQQWLHGDCKKDSQCDGEMKCCGSFHKTCMTPLEQPHPTPCMDSMGNTHAHGYLSTGERNSDLDFCLVCMCFDGNWLCKKLTCTAAYPKPRLAMCDGKGESMGEMVATGSTQLHGCKAIACFNGTWLSDYLHQCVEWKEGKKGKCPRMEPRSDEECSEHREPKCHTDDECDQYTQKCCFDGCTMSCVNAVDERQGSCPKPSFMDIMMHGSCEDGVEDECASDDDCPDEDKCCFNGCHRSCKHKEEEAKKSECRDPANPNSPVYNPGQIIKKGDCNICVCVGMDWVCSASNTCNANVPMLPCKFGNKTLPSGTYHKQDCVHRVCLNGEWKYKLGPGCCPTDYYCMVHGEKMPSGAITWDANSCHACVCMDGIQTCKQFDPEACSNGEVPMPTCWHGDEEYETGAVMSSSKMVKKCVCYFGLWRCASWSDIDKELDMKRGKCPAIFNFFEESKDDDDYESKRGRQRGGMWNDRGIPFDQQRDMRMSDGTVLSALREWLQPPREEGGDADGMSRGESMPGRGEGPGSRPEGGGQGGSGPPRAEGGDPDGMGRGDPMPGGRGGEDHGFGNWSRPEDGGQGGSGRPRAEDEYSGGMSKDSGEYMSGRGEMKSNIKELVKFVQTTRFDGCSMDKDCHGEKVCCGAQIGGTCISPEPSESLPLPCEFEDKYFAHGSIHKEAMMEPCQACACVHGMWQCEELPCDHVKEELKNCSVGPEESGLMVPSGSQQFLQCELCVCLSGHWKCSDRACSNDNTDAMCPDHLPPNVYPHRDRCRGKKDCGRGEKCCGYKDSGRVCVPMKMPNHKNGECPAKVDKPCSALTECMTDNNCRGMMKCCRQRGIQSRCPRIGPGKGVCVKPSGDHCPGGAMSYAPCGDTDPCDRVSNCASDSTLTCEKQECGSCKAAHYDERGMSATCQAWSGTFCRVHARKLTLAVGESIDNPKAPCQTCVCQGNGELDCTKHRKCGIKHRRFKVRFESEDCSRIFDEDAKKMLMREIRALIAAFAKIPAHALKDIEVNCGSIDVEMSLLERPLGEEHEEMIDVDAVYERLEQEVNSGQLVLTIDGEPHASVPDSFQGVRTHSDEYHFALLLAPIIGVIVIVLIISFTLCFIKSKGSSGDREKALPMK